MTGLSPGEAEMTLNPNLRRAVKIGGALVTTFVMMLAVGAGAVENDCRNAPPASVVRRLLPELANPRLATARDVPDDQQQLMRDEGLVFYLGGDFNGDGQIDVAVAGRLDHGSDPDRSFVAIFSKADGRWKRAFMLRPGANLTTLQSLGEGASFVPEGRPGIVARFTLAPSDDYVVIFWDGHKYQYRTGFDLIREEIEELRKKGD